MHKQKFAAGETIIHRLDPRLKLVLAVIYSTLLAVSFNFHVLTSGLFFGGVLILLARLEISRVFRRLLLVNFFLLFIWLVLPVTMPGEVIYTLGPIPVKSRGLWQALRLTVRTNSILLVLIALLSTTKITELTRALAGLGLPDKLVGLFFLVFRYLQDFHQEYLAVYRAALARGFQPSADLRTYRTFAHLFGQLFLKAFERSNRVYDAMRCRNSAGVLKPLKDFNFELEDWLAVAGAILLFTALLLITLL